MMENYDQSVEINQNPNWPYIPDHSHRILIIGGSGTGETNVLLNVIINQQPDIDNIFLYVKDSFKSKYQLLINVREKVGIKKLKNPRAFIDYSQTIDDVYENLEDNNRTKKRKLLIVFDDMIADMESNKKLSPIVTELFSRGRRIEHVLWRALNLLLFPSLKKLLFFVEPIIYHRIRLNILRIVFSK